MDDKQYQLRMHALRERMADLWLPKDVFASIERITRSAHENYLEVDPSILQLDITRLSELNDLLATHQDDKKDGINLRLSNLDMFDLEKLSLYAEEFYGDLGGEEQLGMTPPDITALSEKLGKYRETTFPAG